MRVVNVGMLNTTDFEHLGKDWKVAGIERI